MSINLRREQAPISSKAWAAIDAEARRVLETDLAGRRVVDLEGPHGWESASVPLGRAEPQQHVLLEGVETTLRRSQPMIELRIPFTLSRAELDDLDRGSDDPELSPLIKAAIRLARAEDTAIFHGYAPGGILGMSEHAAHAPLPISTDYERYPRAVAEAMNTLKHAGVGGPYAIALGPRCWAGLMQAPIGDGGYPVIEKVKLLLDGPIIWAPAVDGAVVLSLRSGDFVLHLGQDVSIGYSSHDDASIRLYLVESFTFRLLTPEAAVPLRYK